MSESTQVRLMQQALALARRGWGRTHPNPMVGALVVENGEVVAEGWHAHDGGPHAEIVALQQLGRRPAAGAILYVTMEPCSSPGRTGACTDAILAAGLRKVVIGTCDPNPLHAGRGVEVLRAGGVDTTFGVLEDACTDLNLIFNFWITHHRPLIAAKVGMTLDSQTATVLGNSKWITGSAAREDVMHWRDLFPAIAVGSGTLIADDPQLTIRHSGQPERCGQRFILDRSLNTLKSDPLPVVYTDAFASQTTLITGAHSSGEALQRAADLGVRVWNLGAAKGREFWDALLQRLAAERICGLYVEGGSRLLGALMEHSLIDYLFVYRAPILFADLEAKAAFSGRRTPELIDAVRLHRIQRQTFADDDLIRGFLRYPKALTERSNAESPDWGLGSHE